jgi:cobalt/nickel transport system permease protein
LSGLPVYWEGDEAGRSVVARLDPRTRLLAALAFVLSVIAVQSIGALELAVIAALVLVGHARLPVSAMGHRLLHVEGFMIVLFVLLPFTVPGQPLLQLGPLVATGEGAFRALTIALKVNASVLAIFALLSSLEPVCLGRAMARLGVPLKLAHLFLFTVRYVGVLHAETARLLDAMRARAFVPRSSRHGWRTLGNLIGMMIVRSVERAERVDEAMRCRGFSGRFPLAAGEVFGRADAVFGLLAGLTLIALIAADRLA